MADRKKSSGARHATATMNYGPRTTDHGLPNRPPRRWRAKFGDAFRGLKLGVRGHSSFFVHFFFTALAIAAAIVLRCSLVQWCLLTLCVGLVLMAELFNSAIEALFHGADEKTKARSARSLDIAAAAVLVASTAAALVGAAIFLYQLSELLGWDLGGAGW